MLQSFFNSDCDLSLFVSQSIVCNKFLYFTSSIVRRDHFGTCCGACVHVLTFYPVVVVFGCSWRWSQSSNHAPPMHLLRTMDVEMDIALEQCLEPFFDYIEIVLRNTIRLKAGEGMD